LKILLSNLEYCTGIDGSLFHYFIYGIKYLFCPKFVQMRILKKVSTIIKRENPDVCCLLEVNKGALNRAFVGQMKELSSLTKYPFFDVETKYARNSVFRYVPFFSSNCNGFLAKERFEINKYFIRKSAKGLIYEILLNDKISLFSAHFSVWNWIRKSQYEQISKIILERNNDGREIILCGDFNLFWGHETFQKFVKSCDLNVVNESSDKTFPACKPKRAIDLFLVSEKVKVKKLKVLHDQFSDHLPVMLEIM